VLGLCVCYLQTVHQLWEFRGVPGSCQRSPHLCPYADGTSVSVPVERPCMEAALLLTLISLAFNKKMTPTRLETDRLYQIPTRNVSKTWPAAAKLLIALGLESMITTDTVNLRAIYMFQSIKMWSLFPGTPNSDNATKFSFCFIALNPIPRLGPLYTHLCIWPVYRLFYVIQRMKI
jgi:hypothetical protein